VSLQLKAYREDRGLTQTQVVDEIYRRAVARGDKPPGLCPAAVSRHENGHKRPSLYYQAWYCDIYRATPEQLGFRSPLPGEAAHMATASLSSTEDEDVRRRGFLALLGATALSPFESKLESIRRGLTLPRRPSDRDLHEWERTAYAYWGELSATPPAQLLVHLLADFDEVVTVLDQSWPDNERRRLTHVAGQLAVLTAHSLVSLGEQQAARRWWRTARAAADCAGDPVLAAFVHGQQAVLSLYGSYTPAQVLDLVDEAEAVARGTACAGLASALGARAQALATLGRTTAARKTLKDLRTVLQRLPDHVTGEQHFCCGWPEHRLHHIESYTFTRLGELRDAEEAQDRALALYEPTSWRGPAQIGLHRAACLVAGGEIAGGVDHAAGVLKTLPDERRRDGFIEPVGRAVLAQLPERARRLPAVQDYRELLTDPARAQPSVR
jgi:hypothetical protein